MAFPTRNYLVLLTLCVTLATLSTAFRPKVNGRYLSPSDLAPIRHRSHIRNIFGSLQSTDSYCDISNQSPTTPTTAPSNSSNPIIYVTDYGADPSGSKDSTLALQSAIAEALTRGSKNSNVSLANNITDLGGVTIHLQGGDYLISSPLIIPQYYGNLRIVYGTIRASSTFTPTSSYLLIIGDDSSSKCSNPQGSCNENVAIENLMLDASHIASGCVHVLNTMGMVVDQQMFFLGFTAAGITISGGHETMINEAWFGEYLYSSNAYNTAQATAIQLFGNDHYVTNTVVFSSKIGVHVTNPANILQAVHTWNMNAGDGGIGFLVESSQTRLLGCYYDGNDVVVVAPIQTVSIEDGFFLGSSQVLLQANGANAEIDGLSVVDNQFLYGSAKEAIVALDESKGKFSMVKEMTVRDNLLQGGHAEFPQPRVSQSQTLSGTKQYVFDFEGMLLFDVQSVPFAWIEYSVQYNDDSFTPHALRMPNGTQVVVEFEQPTSASVYLTVDQSSSSLY